MILPGVKDPRNYVDSQNLGQSKWDQKLGKIECVFSLYDNMEWKWDDVYILRGLANIYSPSLNPPALSLYLRTPAVALQRCTWRLWSSMFGDARGGCDRARLEMHLETERLSELRDVLGGRNWASLEMHLETERLSDLRDAPGGRDWASLEMHLEAEIMWTQWCTRKP